MKQQSTEEERLECKTAWSAYVEAYRRAFKTSCQMMKGIMVPTVEEMESFVEKVGLLQGMDSVQARLDKALEALPVDEQAILHLGIQQQKKDWHNTMQMMYDVSKLGEK
jgi:hypothetical protein